MPKVSVISGYYNRRDHLEGTIRSVLGQTFADLELLVFDDGSRDGTGERLRELASQLNDPRLKTIFHEKNGGFTRGMVDAVAMSKGEYVAIQGSGDISLPTRIEKQVTFLDTHPEVGVVGCYYTNIFADSGVRREREPKADIATFESLQRENVFSHGEVMFRRNAYDDAGGYRPAFINSQDIDLWLRIIRTYKLGVVREQLYERFVRMDGVSYAPKKFANQARYSMLARRFAKLPVAAEAEAVQRLERDGPVALVPKEDPELQRRYVRAGLRSMVWGARHEAMQLINENIVSAPTRAALLALGNILGSPLGGPLLRSLQKVFKVG